MTDICERMASKIDDLETRMDNIELSTSKKMILNTGLKGAAKKELNYYIMDFLKKVLGLKMLVDECFTLGQQNPKPIVVVFQTIQDKQMVMQAKHLLKGETSDADRKIYISDYTPQVVQDKRKRDADVRKIALGKHG